MPASPRVRRSRVAVVALAVVVAVVVTLVIALKPRTADVATLPPAGGSTTTSTQPPTTAPLTPTPTFDKHQHSLTSPSSDWVLVNKKNPLDPKTYVPPLAPLNLPGDGGQMRPDAAAALQKMFAAYHAQSSTGGQLSVVSSYRSYTKQISTYNRWVSRLGKAQADRQSARPGFSEHQTGLAVDINTAIDQDFGKTPAGAWLARNSWKFGFIVRYQDGQESVIGYEYEPWHFRYVGTSLATEMHKTGAKSLEAFFGYPAAPTY